MAQVARLTNEGDNRRATALMFGTGTPRSVTYIACGLGWVVGGSFAVDDPSDMLTTIAAEDAFDAEPALPRVQAPTLVLTNTSPVPRCRRGSPSAS
jgi:hypothetical protein